ncbi:ABC transporter permease, partial [Parapedobacter defluvii]|uniref:ABC transporter permease n=1 Tax=Parapedobacter defluvii TaxID=2045106 RepID=UPI0033424CDD
MLTNYLKTTWRSLVKKKGFSFINILGLTIGITVCLMIFIYIVNEFSVDRFHVNNDRIYRVMRGVGMEGGGQSVVAYLSGPYAPALSNDFGQEIEEVVRVNPTEGLVTIGDRS